MKIEVRSKKPDPPIKRPSLAENALSSLKRPSLEAMQKYLKKERLDRDENDPISTNLFTMEHRKLFRLEPFGGVS